MEEKKTEDILAIDIMNHPLEARNDLGGDTFMYEEFRIMTRTTFKTVFKGFVPTPEQLETISKEQRKTGGALQGHASVAEMIKDMDELGYDKIVICATKMWSYYYHHKLILDYSIDDVGDIVREAKGRVIGGASYNPFRIEDSLREVEKGVKEYGFKYVWFHPLSFGLRPDDRRFYPLYAKCCELDIAVGMQVGHSAEVLPSEVGHPMYVDNVALEFPNLRINLSHTGWPWVDEWCSMLWRHINVYGDISAYYARSLEPNQIRFMNGGRGRDKVLFGTNGLGLKRCKEEFMALDIRDDTKSMVLRDNAIRFLKLDE